MTEHFCPPSSLLIDTGQPIDYFFNTSHSIFIYIQLKIFRRDSLLFSHRFYYFNTRLDKPMNKQMGAMQTMDK